MGGSLNHPIPQNLNDWMRLIERRLVTQERREPQFNIQRQLGPGFNKFAHRIVDWNTENTWYSGHFWSDVGNVNSPDTTIAWIGITRSAYDNGGTQDISSLDGVIRKTRSFTFTDGGIPVFTDWVDGPGGGGGGGGGSPTGPAGGDLTGTYPSPTIAAGAVDSSKVADGSLTATDLAPGTIPTALPPSGAAGGDLTGTYPNPTIGAGKVTSTAILDGTIQAADIAPGVIPTVPTSLPPSGPAGGDLTGTYPNPLVKDTQLDLANMVQAIVQSGIGYSTSLGPATGAATTADAALRKLGTGANDAAAGNDSRFTDSRTPSGPAGGGLTGTYPNPTLAANSVGASQITDGTVGNAELAPNAVDSSKIADGSVAKTDLTTALQTQIDGAAVDSLVVHKAGAETITGVKTFDASPVQTYQSTTPPPPPAGHATGIYFGADGLPYYETPGGVVVPVSVGNTTQSALHLNPSYENWDSSTQPTSWDTFWQNNATVAQETTDVLNGTKSLTSNLAAVAGANHLILSSVFTVASGDLVNVGVWARAVAGTPNISVGIMSAASGTPAPFDGVSSQQTFDWVGISATWTKYEKQFTIPAGHTVCRLIYRTGKASGDATAATVRVDYTLSARTGQSTSVLPGNSWPKEAVRAVDTGTGIPTSTAPSTVDGVSLAVGDRVLKAIPGGHVNNGIWTVTTVGTGANGVWARTSDATTPAQLAGAEVAVASGTLYGGTRWGTNLKATDIVGTTVMVWAIVPRDVPSWRSLSVVTAGSYNMLTTAQVVGWDTSNGGTSDLTQSADKTQVIVGKAGVYDAQAECCFQQTGGAGTIWYIASLVWRRAGAVVRGHDVVEGTSPGMFCQCTVHDIFDAQVGDTFEVAVTCQYSSLSNMQGGNRSHFNVRRLSGLG